MAQTTIRQRKAQGSAVKAYLVTYNLVSFLLWSTILYTTLHYILSGPHILPPISQNATHSLGATAQARQFISGLGERFFGFPPVHSNPVKPFTSVAAGGNTVQLVPQALAAFLSGSYATHVVSFFPSTLTSALNKTIALGKGLALGPFVTWTQSLAVLEVLHAASGLVKSSVAASVMQVASRVWMVWGVVEGRGETHSNPLYTTMILAWSITESIRYAFYACSLLGFQPKPLLWLRYNTFYVLYPLGAGSEAFLMASVLPPLRTLPSALKSLIKHQQSAGLLDMIKRTVGAGSLSAVRGWAAYELFVGFLFVIWWPALYVLFTHMIVLRRKVFGKGKTLGGVPGSREKKRQ